MKKHLVFHQKDIAAIQAAQALDEALSGEVLCIADDYAVGPLYVPGHAEAWQQRRDWWYTLLGVQPQQEELPALPMLQDPLTTQKLKDWLAEAEDNSLWIWAAQNQHDVCGYYWLVSQLAAFQGKVLILYLNNLPFINEQGGIFYPVWLRDIPAKEFLKAKKLARAITPSEFEIDTDEWLRIASGSSELRLLEGGKKLSVQAADYYDTALMQYVGADFSKVSRVLQQFAGKAKAVVEEPFVLWRLRTLIQAGKLEAKGDAAKGPKEFEVRLAK